MRTVSQLDEFGPGASDLVNSVWPKTREKVAGQENVVSALNQALAHIIDLETRTKRAHWNAKGGNFYSLHKMLDDFAGDLDAIADEIGERVMAVGGVATGNVFEVAKRSTLTQEPPRSTRADDVIKSLKDDYDVARMEVRKSFETLAVLEDDASMDIALGTMKLLDKQRSFLKAQMAI